MDIATISNREKRIPRVTESRDGSSGLDEGCRVRDRCFTGALLLLSGQEARGLGDGCIGHGACPDGS